MRKSPIRVWGEVISLACCQVDLPEIPVWTKQGGGRTWFLFSKACWHVQVPAWPGKGAIPGGGKVYVMSPPLLQVPFTGDLLCCTERVRVLPQR